MYIAFLNPQGNFDSADTGWTLHPDFGGQLVYVKEVASAIGRIGHSVDIITRQINDPDWPQFKKMNDAYTGNLNIRIIRIPCGPPEFLPKEELWKYLPEWSDNIINYFKKENLKPDFFTTHYADGGFSGAIIKSKTGIPFSFTGHSLCAQKMDKFIHSNDSFDPVVRKFNFDKRICAERIAMKYSDIIFTSTKLEKNDQYGHKLYKNAIDPTDQKFMVVPPGANITIFNQDDYSHLDEAISKKVKYAIERDILHDRKKLPMVICSSRLDRKKNHLDLVKAWAVNPKLRSVANLAIIVRGTENPLKEWHTIFDGTEKEIFGELIKVIEKENLSDCITAFDLNNQLELAACYRYLAKNLQGIFALTARYEPFGLAPLEAIACGLPVVVTKNGGPSESLQDENGNYGILVDPQDPNDIAQGILQLIAKNIWSKMQKVGIERVKNKYTWEQTAKGYLNEISRVLTAKKNISIKSDLESKMNIDLDEFKKQYFKN